MTTDQATESALAVDRAALVVDKAHWQIMHAYYPGKSMMVEYPWWSENFTEAEKAAVKERLLAEGWASLWDDEVGRYLSGIRLYLWNPKDWPGVPPYETHDQVWERRLSYLRHPLYGISVWWDSLSRR
jgi:hypothetical protein